jgi:hypothetical protein
MRAPITGQEPPLLIIQFTPNIKAAMRRSCLYECAVRAKRKRIKLSCDSGNSGSKKCKRGYGGTWQGLGLVEVWSQSVSFV